MERKLGATVAGRALLLALAATLAIAAAAAAEATPTRAEYVVQLEAICRPGAEATQRTMKGARDDVRAGRISVAAGKFSRATKIFARTLDRIAAVPRPSADAEKLAKWFVYLNRQESYLQQITTQLRGRHTIQAQRLMARFIHNGNLANNTVLPFGFNYCGFKFARFG